MKEYHYPEGIECVWIASDRNGYLGAFTTAGVGPIPRKALTSKLFEIEDVEEVVCRLPKISETHLFVSMKRLDDFVAMAERGFFVYDWRDAHRTTGESKNTYELITAPISPIKSDALPESLAKLVTHVCFGNLAFADNKALDIYEQFECLIPHKFS
ncbi:MAG: hypothetical protein H7Z73_01725 [Candidatus Saccharibacteria bacterium]|nr:hypothetical protein [Moraxellaceae bacterium]